MSFRLPKPADLIKMTLGAAIATHLTPERIVDFLTKATIKEGHCLSCMTDSLFTDLFEITGFEFRLCGVCAKFREEFTREDLAEMRAYYRVLYEH